MYFSLFLSIDGFIDKCNEKKENKDDRYMYCLLSFKHSFCGHFLFKVSLMSFKYCPMAYHSCHISYSLFLFMVSLMLSRSFKLLYIQLLAIPKYQILPSYTHDKYCVFLYIRLIGVLQMIILILQIIPSS